jgi:hypothetical protein
MTTLVPPTFASAASGVPILLDLGVRNAGATTVRLYVESLYAISGNGAYVTRLYDGATPLALTTLIGAQQGPVGVDSTSLWDLNAYTAGHYLTGFISSSTVGSLAGWFEAYDDVGFFSGGRFGGGGFHDPMLDDILAAVRRDFPVTS